MMLIHAYYILPSCNIFRGHGPGQGSWIFLGVTEINHFPSYDSHHRSIWKIVVPCEMYKKYFFRFLKGSCDENSKSISNIPTYYITYIIIFMLLDDSIFGFLYFQIWKFIWHDGPIIYCYAHKNKRSYSLSHHLSTSTYVVHCNRYYILLDFLWS